MKVKFPNKTKLDGVWYQALDEIEINKKDIKKFIELGAMLVAEYEILEEEPIKEVPVKEVETKEKPEPTPSKGKKQK